MSEACKPRPLPESPETNWIRAFLDGDRWGFDQLVLHFQDRVFNLCYRMLGDYDDARTVIRNLRQVYRLADFGSKPFLHWLCTLPPILSQSAQVPGIRTQRKMVRIDTWRAVKPWTPSLELPTRRRSPDRFTPKKQEGRSSKRSQPFRGSQTLSFLRDIEGLCTRNS